MARARSLLATGRGGFSGLPPGAGLAARRRRLSLVAVGVRPNPCDNEPVRPTPSGAFSGANVAMLGTRGQMATRGLHVMVINDTAEILDLFRDILEEEGFRVTTGSMVAGGLHDAVREIKRVMPDLLILDYLFGNEPLGWQLLQMLRMDRATAPLPVVVCTAAVARLEEMSAHLAKMGVGFVIKPFDIDALLDEVNRTLARAREQAPGRPEKTPANGAKVPTT
jgi:CheY-like chemotaxis protein